MLDVPSPRPIPGTGSAKPPRPVMVRLIAGLALFKALVFAISALGVLNLSHRDVEQTLDGWLAAIHLDPDGERLHRLVATIAGVPVAKLRLVGFGAIFYAALYLVEGVGLWFDQTWAEWLTAVGSSLLLPIELYEMVEHLTALKTSVFVVNLVVVAYLAMRLRKKHRAKHPHAAAAA
jgi:uncharacterized membrane protein (DUF2068 family)